jgi:hypothetical protein
MPFGLDREQFSLTRWSISFVIQDINVGCLTTRD